MKSDKFKFIIAAAVGNTMEWYEFTIYAYFAANIGHIFFPVGNHTASLLLTFMTFAVGLMVRPIGGMIFGYIGDTKGRKKALTLTMLIMAFSTLAIGILPTYSQLGIVSPVLLLLLRIAQGIALGGEFGLSCVYLTESAPYNKRGLWSSVPLTGIGLGLLLSSCTVLLLESTLSKQDIILYGWRIPFFISVFAALVAFYIRKNFLEAEVFVKAKANSQVLNRPIYDMFTNYKSAVLCSILMMIGTKVTFYTVFIFGKTLIIDHLNYDDCMASQLSLASILGYTSSTLLFGYLSDKTNRYWILLSGIILVLVLTDSYVSALENGSPFFLSVSFLIGVGVGMMDSAISLQVFEFFPVRLRATGVSFCWNVASALFGGTAPIIAIWLIDYAGISLVAYYIKFACFSSLCGLVYVMLRTKSKLF